MDVFVQLFLNTLITGSIYGVMAMTFALAYRPTHFFNLAHGSMAAIGGYMFLFLNRDSGWPFLPALAVSILAAGFAGFLIDRFIFSPQRRRRASGAVLLVSSLGVVTVVEAIISMIFTTQFKPLMPLAGLKTYAILGATITQTQAIIILFNLAAFAGIMVLLYKTKFGRLLRAISDDPEVARILGIRVNLFIGWVFFIAAALAGAMGVLVGFDTGLQPTMGFYLLLKGIIAAIIGCVASVPGGFIGGFILAAVENAGVWVFDTEWRDAIAFTLLVLFLVFRPQGLLGKEG